MPCRSTPTFFADGCRNSSIKPRKWCAELVVGNLGLWVLPEESEYLAGAQLTVLGRQDFGPTSAKARRSGGIYRAEKVSNVATYLFDTDHRRRLIEHRNCCCNVHVRYQQTATVD